MNKFVKSTLWFVRVWQLLCVCGTGSFNFRLINVIDDASIRVISSDCNDFFTIYIMLFEVVDDEDFCVLKDNLRQDLVILL